METNLDFFSRLSETLAGGAHYNFRSHAKEHQNFITRAEGSRVWDIEGNEYLDLHAKFGAMVVGHGNPDYNDFLKSQIDKVLSINHSDLDIQACELIKAQFPGMEMLRFCLSGTEAVQNAIRLARAYTRKELFVRIEGHYHGNSDNIMGGKLGELTSPYPVEFKGDPRGTEGRLKNVFRDQSLMVRWNDIEHLETVLQAHHEKVAAFILEPILINGGGIAPAPGYLQKIRELCTRYNIVLIFDEVITGLRVGPGGAQSLFGVTPDLTVLGKAISGGVPVSILGGKQDIMRLYADRRVIHAGTFNGYPLGMASIIATLKILSADEFAFYARAQSNLSEVKRILHDACTENGLGFSMNVFGSIGVFHCQENPITSPADIDYQTQVKNSLLFRTLPKFGILISPETRLFINYQFDESDLAYLAERAGQAIEACAIQFDQLFN